MILIRNNPRYRPDSRPLILYQRNIRSDERKEHFKISDPSIFGTKSRIEVNGSLIRKTDIHISLNIFAFRKPRRRLELIGFILRMDPYKHPKTALTWALEGRRSRGRTKKTWRRTAEKERTALGFISWSEATNLRKSAWVAKATCDMAKGSVQSYAHLGLWPKLSQNTSKGTSLCFELNL